MKFFLIFSFLFVAVLAHKKCREDSRQGSSEKSKPTGCYCKQWRRFAQCIQTRGNNDLDKWLKNYKADPAKIHACANKTISSNPEPTSLADATKIVAKILNCASWRWYWDIRNFDQSIWEICKRITSDAEAKYLCSLEAPVVQQAVAKPTNFSTIYKLSSNNSYSCDTLKKVSLSGGCAVCPQINGSNQCASACSTIYAGALKNSSCVKGLNPSYSNQQSCVCTICAIKRCPDGSTEVDGYCYKYQPTWTNCSATQANSQCVRTIGVSAHLINVRIKQEWDSTLKYIQNASSGFTYGEPFWIGINHQNNTPWNWYVIPSALENNATDYIWTGPVWAANQPDNIGGYFGIPKTPLFPVGAVAVYNNKTDTYEIYDDYNVQPYIYTSSNVTIRSICQTNVQDYPDLWAAVYGQPWQPPTTSQSQIKFCSSRGSSSREFGPVAFFEMLAKRRQF